MGFYGDVMNDKEWLEWAVNAGLLTIGELTYGGGRKMRFYYEPEFVRDSVATIDGDLEPDFEFVIRKWIKKQSWNYQINYYAPEDGHSSVVEIWKSESRSLRTFKQSGDTELEALMLAFREAMEAQQ